MCCKTELKKTVLFVLKESLLKHQRWMKELPLPKVTQVGLSIHTFHVAGSDVSSTHRTKCAESMPSGEAVPY